MSIFHFFLWLQSGHLSLLVAIYQQAAQLYWGNNAQN